MKIGMKKWSVPLIVNHIATFVKSVNMDLFTVSRSPHNLYVWYLLKFILAHMVIRAPTVLIDFLRSDI